MAQTTTAAVGGALIQQCVTDSRGASVGARYETLTARVPEPLTPSTREEELEDFVNVDSLQALGVNASDITKLKAS